MKTQIGIIEIFRLGLIMIALAVQIRYNNLDAVIILLWFALFLGYLSNLIK